VTLGGGNTAWRKSVYFLQLLADTGGLPQLLEFLLDRCLGINFEDAPYFFSHIGTQNFVQVFQDLVNAADAAYHI